MAATRTRQIEQTPFSHGDIGTAEPDWRDHLQRRRLGLIPGVAVPFDLSEELRAGRRLLVVAPHPDDETLGAGGTISTAVARGVHVTVLSCSDGEAAFPFRGLASRRRAELLGALERLGGGAGIELVRLSLPDGQLDRHRGRLVREIARRVDGADLVVGPWSGDGHPDHAAVGHACENACAAADRALHAYPVWAWHWGHAQLFDGCDLSTLELDPTAMEAKREALQHFRSQIGSEGIEAILTPNVLAHFTRDHETFVRSRW